MENNIGKWKTVLLCLRILFATHFSILMFGIFFYWLVPFLYNKYILFIFSPVVLIPILFWFLPHLLRLIVITSKNIKLKQYAVLEGIFRKEIYTFLAFPAMASIIIFLGEIPFFGKSGIYDAVGSILLLFSVIGYWMLLCVHGLKGLLSRRNIWLKIAGVILSLLFLAVLWGFVLR